MKTLIIRNGAKAATPDSVYSNGGNCEEASPAEALSKALAYKPDLIALDAALPAQEGLRLIQAIQAEEGLKDVRFCFYPASGAAGAETPAAMWTRIRGSDETATGQTSRTGSDKRVLPLQDLRESEERLKTLINGTPDIICFKDGRGRWLEANDADLELFNLKGVPYHGKTDSELAAYSPLHRAAFLACEASDEIAWQKGVVSRSEENIPRYDGTVSVYDVIKSPVFNADGGRKGLVVLGRDITERKQAEDKIKAFNAILEQKVKDRTAELLASNEELQAFSYSVSHDLKGPLRRMEGFTTMLEEVQGSALSGDARGYMERIKSSAAGMEILIERMLILSRTGRGRMSFEPVPLSELVSEAINELSDETAGRKIAWVMGKFPSVTGDRAMLKQVFLNLLGNAIKYTRPRANARIEISAKHKGEETIVSVRDNGVGFDMEQAGRLYGISQRLHSAAEFEGTGIGLYTIRRIITGHGGKVWAEGETGKGATFGFSIPDTPPGLTA